jgi:hypothetical protein
MRSALPPGFIAPCLPIAAERCKSGPAWVHEIKHDGARRHAPASKGMQNAMMKAQIAAALKEHLSYELDMLEGSFVRLHSTEFADQLKEPSPRMR